MRGKHLFAVILPFLLVGFAPTVQQQRIDLDLTAQPGQLLDIDLENVTGDIEIIGGSGDRVVINGTVSAREWRSDNEVIVDQNPSGIRLYSEYLEGRQRGRNDRRMRADLTIRVPHRFDINLAGAMSTRVRDIEGRIEVTIGNDDIVASGLSGEANLRVANGNLHISGSDLAGRLSNTNGSLRFEGGSFRGSLDSTNGGAEIDRVSGDLEIGATNGNVSLGPVAGSLRGASTNGNISAGEVAGNVRLETTNGSVTVTLVGEGEGDDRVEIETLNGSVELAAPAGISARFDIEVRQSRTEHNRERPEIRSDFPLDIGTGAISGREYRQEASGANGGGGPRIGIRATNGNVVIRSSG